MNNRLISLLFALPPFIYGAAVAQEKPDYAPERVAYLQTTHFEKPLHIWLPKNYDWVNKHPVMFYYHATTGEPTIEYMRLYTGGEDWILIGMTYLKPGRFQFSKENLATEQKILEEVLATVSQDVSIDPNRVFVSGFSKGGWVTGLILQNDSKLAGGMILGAGTFTDGITDHSKKLYIGIGETDPNLAMSFRARREFSANPATEIDLEIWPEIGHQFPLKNVEPSSDHMKQWLRVQAGVATQKDAIKWMEDKLLATDKSAELSRFQKLEIIQRMQAAPYAELLDSEGKGALEDAVSDFRKLPGIEQEERAKTEFFKVLEYESKDRLVSTLAECASSYSKIATAFPETEYGKKSAVSVERITQTLGGTPN